MEQLFITGTIPRSAIILNDIEHYNLWLVLLSYFLASMGSYLAIWVLRVSKTASASIKRLGVVVGAIVMSTAIWSMHYTGMLSYNMTMVHTYDPILTALSGLVAFLFSLSVFDLLIHRNIAMRTILLSAPMLGIGVATMHYSGMEAMEMDADLRYDPTLFLLSVVVAVTASGAALFIMNKVITLKRHQHIAQVLASLTMGVAVCGMHYTGMAASVFLPFADCRFDENQDFVNFGLTVSAAACLVIGLALGFLYFAIRGSLQTSLKVQFKLLSRSLYITLGLVSAVIFVTGLTTYDIHNTLDDIANSQIKDTKLQKELIYLKTMRILYAKSAANTGDTQWKKKHAKDSMILNGLIEEASGRYSEKVGLYGITAVKEANDQLFNIEHQVFERVELGQLQEAKNILSGSEYVELKQNYLDAIQSFGAITSVELQRGIDTVNHRSNILLFIVIPGFTALLIGVLALLHGRKLMVQVMQEQAFNQKVLDCIADPIFIKGADHSWQGGNLAFCELIGSKHEQFIGTHYSEFFVNQPQEELWQKEQSVTELSITSIDDEQVRNTSGKVIDVMVTRSPLQMPDGNHGLVGVIHDIAHLKQVEAQLQEHKKNLESLVAEQTVTLKEALKEAQAASDLKSEFLANMSHELRTPLNSIIGMTDLLLEDQLTDPQEDMVGIVSSASKNLLEIVNDILDLSKIESGALELESISFDAQQIISDTVNMLKPLASQKDIVLNWHGKQLAPIFVIGDPVRYGRIVTNLISNAIKFTDVGSVDVYLDSHVTEGDQRMLTCVVQDTGVGIAADKIEHIYGKFTQADTSTTRKYGGSGLGLAITKQLVEKMAGNIKVKSELGKGTQFTVAIPFTLGQASGYEEQCDELYSQCGIIPLHEADILVAEDHPLNQVYIVKLLESMGAKNIGVVGDGAQAVDLVQQQDFDLILMDCHMPEMDGFLATRRIRKLGTKYEQLPIVALTANAMPGSRERCIREGMNDYLSKPVGKAQLTKVLSNWIRIDTEQKPADDHLDDSERQPTLDLTKIRSFSGDDKSLEQEFADIFIEQADQQLETLADNAVTGQSPAWVETSHLLKGGAATIGAMHLSSIAANAQQMFSATSEERELIYQSMLEAYAEVKEHLASEGLYHGEKEERQYARKK